MSNQKGKAKVIKANPKVSTRRSTVSTRKVQNTSQKVVNQNKPSSVSQQTANPPKVCPCTLKRN